MRKARAVVCTTVTALAMSLTIGAAPAQAADRLVGVFKHYADCERVGHQGITQDWWQDYSCVWESRYRYFFLYA
ncbi:hypothetical protein ACFMQL_38735 [Nonomuraea fastidiosa]|jgi:hypothetical protein|uniref:hypothetical protein n=1 Tax=Nonomuraea TaxID=83681 RepID=UPI003243032F